MQTRTFLQILVFIVVSIILTFFLWLIAKNVTKEEVRYFAIGITIFVGTIMLLIVIISLSSWNFKNVSKTIHEIGQTYQIHFDSLTTMLTKANENSNNKNPIIIHNTGTSTQTTPLIPDQKNILALNSQNKKPELEYITLKELGTGESKELNPKFFENIDNYNSDY